MFWVRLKCGSEDVGLSARRGTVSHWPSFPFWVIVIMILSANDVEVMWDGTLLIVAVAWRVWAG